MAPIIQILLTLTYVVLGECSLDLDQMVKQLLGLTPSVGPLLPESTPFDILDSILPGHPYPGYPYPLYFKELKTNTRNINSNQNNEPSWENIYTGFNPPSASGTEENAPKTNEIKSPLGHQQNEEKHEDISQNTNGNNNYLLQDKLNGKMNTSNTIFSPISANQPMNYAILTPSQNNQLYELVHGQIVPISIAQTNQNSPYSNTQLKVPNPGYILVYTNPDSNNEQNVNAGSVINNFQNIPVAGQYPEAKNVYIATPIQGQYVLNGQVPKVIAVPNAVVPQKKIIPAVNPDEAANPSESQPLVITANGLMPNETSDKKEPENETHEDKSKDDKKDDN